MTDRPRALAVLIAVFLVGCIIGSAGSFVWMKRPFGPFNRDVRTGPQGGPGQERRRMADLLKLTPEQESHYREIMAESRKQLDQLRLDEAPKLEAIRAEETPKLEAIRAETNRKVKAILTPEQQNKFEGFIKEMESRRRQGRGGRQFGPPLRPMQPSDGTRPSRPQ